MLILDTPPLKEGVELQKEALRKTLDNQRQDLGAPSLEESSRGARNRTGAKARNQRMEPYPREDNLLTKEKPLHTAPQDAWDPAAAAASAATSPPTPSTPGDGLDLGGRMRGLASITETVTSPHTGGVTEFIQNLEKETALDTVPGEDL